MKMVVVYEVYYYRTDGREQYIRTFDRYWAARDFIDELVGSYDNESYSNYAIRTQKY